MLVISETLARELVSVEDAIRSVEGIFAAMARGEARNYPVVREAVGYRDAVYGVKTGCDVSTPILGLEAGGYWPHNAEHGFGNHQSSTLLFDADSGRASALVSANYLTGVRTGASSVIAAKYLSRRESTVLGIIGTGVQAEYQLKATKAVRDVTEVHAWDPSSDNLARFGRVVAESGLKFVPESERCAVAAAADVLITVTPSQAALVERDWVRPGTHISAMGCDTKGKQELDPKLVAAAALFTDEIRQSVTIGEFQHAFAGRLITEQTIRGTIGEVIEGRCDGRQDDEDVTIFDGTGVSLQDLVVADLAVRLAEEKGRALSVEY